MDKLNIAKQAEIKKMSTVRLTTKLTQADFTLEQLETMDRPAMLEAWAEIVAAGKEITITGAKTAPLNIDRDFEREKFEFEKMKFKITQEKLNRLKREN